MLRRFGEEHGVNPLICHCSKCAAIVSLFVALKKAGNEMDAQLLSRGSNG